MTQIITGDTYRLSVTPTGFLIERDALGGTVSRRVEQSEGMLLWAMTALARMSGVTEKGYEDWWPDWMRENKAKVTE